ncbi:MAG: YCF48-related protein [Ignavibacteriaceae bacterium]|nr:YCF48-related protein [Ignavibacteriaceae bacterium]
MLGISSISPLYLRTTNGGSENNWTVSTITGATGGSASIAALDSITAWVCNTDAVYKTTDGGLTWDQQETAFQGFNGHPNVIHFFDSDNGVCVGNPNNGYWAIYTTTNGGTNWTRVPSANIPSPLPANEIGLSNISVAKDNSFWFPTLWGSLYRTTDRGMTWTVARNILGNSDGFSFAFKDNLNGLACTFIGGKKISHTEDGGTTWTPITPLPSGLSGLSPFLLEYVEGTSGSYVITSNYNIGGAFPAIPGTAYTNDS